MSSEENREGYCLNIALNTIEPPYQDEIVKSIVDYVSANPGLYDFPFWVARCQSCGDYLLTNRYSFEEIPCESCGHMARAEAVETEEARELVKKLEKALGKEVIELKDDGIFILLIFDEISINLTEIKKILDYYGFQLYSEDLECFNTSVDSPPLRYAQIQALNKGYYDEGMVQLFAGSQPYPGELLIDASVARARECIEAVAKLYPSVSYVCFAARMKP